MNWDNYFHQCGEQAFFLFKRHYRQCTLNKARYTPVLAGKPIGDFELIPLTFGHITSNCIYFSVSKLIGSSGYACTILWLQAVV